MATCAGSPAFRDPRATHVSTLLRWTKEAVITAGMVFVVIAIVHYVQLDQQRGGGGDLPVGMAPPSVDLQPMDGGPPVSVASLAGKPVILKFWATWCGHCRSELPDVVRVHDESQGRYHLLSVSSEPPAVVAEYLARRGLQLPVMWDRTHALHDAYKVELLPTTVILDARGQVVHDFTGAADPDILRDHMERLLDSPEGPSDGTSG